MQSTSAPPAVVAVLYATNTVLAVRLQSTVSRQVRSYMHAAQAQRLAGVMLAGCCVCLAASTFGGQTLATVAVVLAVVSLTFAELLKASASWQITFTLAPQDRSGEFLATYGLGGAACQVVGPVLITAVVLALGSTGWLLLALLSSPQPSPLRRSPTAQRRGRWLPGSHLATVRPLLPDLTGPGKRSMPACSAWSKRSAPAQPAALHRDTPPGASVARDDA